MPDLESRVAELEYTVSRLVNWTGSAEGRSLPGRQRGQNRVPLAVNPRVARTVSTEGAREFSVTWQVPPEDAQLIDHFVVYYQEAGSRDQHGQTKLQDQVNSQGQTLVNAPPAIVRVPGVVKGPVRFIIQTVLKNGQASSLEESPRCTSKEATRIQGRFAERKATFGLVKALTVENDLTNHYISRTSGKFKDVAVKVKDAPTGSPARLVIEKSTDKGLTWNNIFKDPGYIELEADRVTLQLYKDVFKNDENGYIAENDLLRINCIQIGSTNPGSQIEVVLRWEE